MFSEQSTRSLMGDCNAIFDWDQTLTEVTLVVPLPRGTQKKMVNVEMTPKFLKILLSGKPIFEGTTFGGLKPSESTWFVSEGTLQILLEKASRGDVWHGIFEDVSLDKCKVDDMKRKLLLERFGDEHPDFDFSDAQFTGDASPDPKTFMTYSR